MRSFHAPAIVFVLAITFAMPLAARGTAQDAAAAVRASTQQMVIPSHGSMLLGIFYLAAGPGPHPTAVLFHGFPGFEQNLDIAQDLRAHGWNVLAMHYRGSWGVKGSFSFEHAAEDADTQVSFVLDAANARKYRIDRNRIIVIGHSMGGYMAASAAAHNKGVAASVLVSAWNIGETASKLSGGTQGAAAIDKLADWLAKDHNLLPLSGTSAEVLAHEMYDRKSALNMNNLAPAIAPRPVFVITANDGLVPVDEAFLNALRGAGDTRVAEHHWDTDHSYSGERVELSQAVLEWSQKTVR
ncbi:MAG TPA: alpha/beta fold hydrolase [Candidatus Acidoferrum sp.]|nr:alpha/beta fold hydrolase [Candidatus Acidoferrum sp.]